jgi:hypothetical protein
MVVIADTSPLNGEADRGEDKFGFVMKGEFIIGPTRAPQ